MNQSTERIFILGGLGLAFAGLGIGFAILLKKGKFDDMVKTVTEPALRAEINLMHPKAKEIFSKFIDRIEKETGYIVRVTSSYRSYEKQAQLDAQDSRNADPGRSHHNFGMALDINLIKGDTWIRKNSPKEQWLKTGVPQIGKEMGLRWGGDFSGYYDPIHFDYGLKYPIAILADAARKQFGNDPAKVRGNEVEIT